MAKVHHGASSANIDPNPAATISRVAEVFFAGVVAAAWGESNHNSAHVVTNKRTNK
jgi:hypothetical protein